MCHIKLIAFEGCKHIKMEIGYCTNSSVLEDGAPVEDQVVTQFFPETYFWAGSNDERTQEWLKLLYKCKTQKEGALPPTEIIEMRRGRCTRELERFGKDVCCGGLQYFSMEDEKWFGGPSILYRFDSAVYSSNQRILALMLSEEDMRSPDLKPCSSCQAEDQLL